MEISLQKITLKSKVNPNLVNSSEFFSIVMFDGSKF
jgi:hypothetical protein